ncbi:hypothetical protein Glove_132g280 [Diversispora epigaea]|uniref:Uncharacterized protein n=1 Tax=Diversispora epigaea TaxID=1348612 RepID=A0A397J051_9GLOM|nr:hypothetical protein Glove_132g280 [Diversispora epigaea]
MEINENTSIEEWLLTANIKKQIITDKILIQNENNKTKIIRNPTKIKNEIKKHMEKWMANPNNDEEEEISEEWKKEYEPKNEIPDEAFKN